MGYISVDPTILEQLKRQFSVRYGNSAARLARAIDESFPDEYRRGYSSLVSSKTIANFFDDSKRRDVSATYLNYYCQVLLDIEDGYEGALERKDRKFPDLQNLPAIDFQKNFEIQVENTARKCQSMKMLTMEEPIEIKNIYTDVNLLKRGQKELIIQSALSGQIPDKNIFKLGFMVSEEGKSVESVVNHNDRIMVWGRLGAGKTTLLKHIATGEKHAENLVKVFLSLKEMIGDDGLNSIFSMVYEDFSAETDEEKSYVNSLFKSGRILLLLDGLDEVSGEYFETVGLEIERMVSKYPLNKYIVSCRYGIYEHGFKDFCEVEVPGFSEEKVFEFIRKWFQVSNREQRGEELIRDLKNNESAMSMAVNPLQLNLLCLMVERGYGIPRNSFELYEEAIEVLLVKWDRYRFISRDETLLSKTKKMDFLGGLAFRGLDGSTKKFRWHTWELADEVRELVKRSPKYNEETLDEDSKTAIKAIEGHHGILDQAGLREYSFSNPAFQQFFTAVYLTRQRDSQVIERAVERHIHDQNWEQIFVLMSEKLFSADELLLHAFRQANVLVRSKTLQDLFEWLNKLTKDCNLPTSSWRAGCLAIDMEIDFNLRRFVIDDKLRFNAHRFAKLLQEYNASLGITLPTTDQYEVRILLAAIHSLAEDFAKQDSLVSLSKPSDFAKSYIQDILEEGIGPQLDAALGFAQNLGLEKLEAELKLLSNAQPAADSPAEQWSEWADRLNSLMLEELDIGHDLELSHQDRQDLNQYLHIGNVILRCLQEVGASVDPELRQKLRSGFLKPQQELQEIFPESLAV